MEFLKKLTEIEAPSGSEYMMKEFLMNYINENKSGWKVQPEIIEGEDFQDNIILVFGEPRTAIFAHMDSIGYTVGYENNLIKIGGPGAKKGALLVGEDSQGRIEGELVTEEDDHQFLTYSLKFNREVERGTTLTYKSDFRETDEFVQCCYMDNRLGMWVALEVAKTLENGIVVFSSWEEHGGGSVGYLGKFLYEGFDVKQALISDITWVTKGVEHNKGVAISLRDSGIPRRLYLNRIKELAKESGIPYQLEVESAGGSDGNALQRSPYPFDWCFIGAPEDNVHTPDEKVHKNDIKAMVDMYNYLMARL
ncbi:M20/M25/M40 family metallo-hydrolase [Vicingus serpentipes]|uniref:M20/M25/M40 family metallo-hydrolase n=1 Tax=Vicingus serpentipes TaxID=1926625 RepID=A0A5C6RU37_9FLAO|nr:M20/M25/M40 family metallo-hydrolase [Vicingus serpentipes]TXB65484.1 M20/M25/M40 family metallo-hydrolase [Vicingus serpentipes]